MAHPRRLLWDRSRRSEVIFGTRIISAQAEDGRFFQHHRSHGFIMYFDMDARCCERGRVRVIQSLDWKMKSVREAEDHPCLSWCGSCDSSQDKVVSSPCANWEIDMRSTELRSMGSFTRLSDSSPRMYGGREKFAHALTTRLAHPCVRRGRTFSSEQE